MKGPRPRTATRGRIRQVSVPCPEQQADLQATSLDETRRRMQLPAARWTWNRLEGIPHESQAAIGMPAEVDEHLSRVTVGMTWRVGCEYHDGQHLLCSLEVVAGSSGCTTTITQPQRVCVCMQRIDDAGKTKPTTFNKASRLVSQNNKQAYGCCFVGPGKLHPKAADVGALCFIKRSGWRHPGPPGRRVGLGVGNKIKFS